MRAAERAAQSRSDGYTGREEYADLEKARFDDGHFLLRFGTSRLIHSGSANAAAWISAL